RKIIARAQTARRVLVVGASFIGLEVAASLRARGLEVHVVAPETRPLEKVLGPQLGDVIRALHEEKGVHFHLGNTVTAFEWGRAASNPTGRGCRPCPRPGCRREQLSPNQRTGHLCRG